MVVVIVIFNFLTSYIFLLPNNIRRFCPLHNLQNTHLNWSSINILFVSIQCFTTVYDINDRSRQSERIPYSLQLLLLRSVTERAQRFRISMSSVRVDGYSLIGSTRVRGLVTPSAYSA